MEYPVVRRCAQFITMLPSGIVRNKIDFFPLLIYYLSNFPAVRRDLLQCISIKIHTHFVRICIAFMKKWLSLLLVKIQEAKTLGM